MLNKPIYLILFPILALGIALSFPVQIMYLYKIPVYDLVKVFSMLTPLNIFTMISLIAASILTMKMHRAVYKIIPILLVITFINNAVVGLYGTDYTVIQVAMSFILLAFSLMPFYNKEVKAVMFNPNLRWWLTPKRYNVSKPVQINSELLEIYSDTMNISATGIFAKVKDMDVLKKLPMNSVINLKFIAEQPIAVQAKVVRKTDESSLQPLGCGLEIIKDQTYKQKYLPWFNKEVK